MEHMDKSKIGSKLIANSGGRVSRPCAPPVTERFNYRKLKITMTGAPLSEA